MHRVELSPVLNILETATVFFFFPPFSFAFEQQKKNTSLLLALLFNKAFQCIWMARTNETTNKNDGEKPAPMTTAKPIWRIYLAFLHFLPAETACNCGISIIILLVWLADLSVFHFTISARRHCQNLIRLEHRIIYQDFNANGMLFGILLIWTFKKKIYINPKGVFFSHSPLILLCYPPDSGHRQCTHCHIQ